jgi:Ca2+/Na+ antiporter
MEVEENSGKLDAIRASIAIPLLIMIVYLTIIWSVVAVVGSFQWYTAVLATIFLCIFLIFLMSRVTIPDSYQERSVEYFIEELLYQDKVFVIPTMCPQCRTPIQLNRVRWEDEYTPLCQECQAEIKLRILEK